MKQSFRYTAVNASGASADGTLSASDEQDAIAQLQAPEPVVV